MRLICTLENVEQGQLFSSFLQEKGIENQLDVSINHDWGSDDYGKRYCNIWVLDEDQVDQALYWLDLFYKDPHHSAFVEQEKKLFAREALKHPFTQSSAPAPGVGVVTEQQIGFLTLSTLIFCSLCFLISQLTTPVIQPPFPSLPPIPLYSPPIQRAMMYDFPHAYDLIVQLEQEYGFEKLRNLQALPPHGQQLLQEFYQTPYWKGLYSNILSYYKNHTLASLTAAPLFEKIREGEIWRLVSPIFLHSDFFHLLFNMIWLLVIGKQMEQKMGRFRYLVFIVLTAIFSNTAQYLMSGSNFIGFSGVLCAMLGFVYIRQRVAPWEGYLLQTTTITFITFFVLAMLGIQVLSFFSEAYAEISISPGIANTAHIFGALAGLSLGYSNFFSIQEGRH